MPTFPIIYFLVCGILSLVLWLNMMGIMEEKGINTSFFWISPKQYLQFYKLIKIEKEPEKRKKYKVLLWSQIALIPIYIFGEILIIGLTI